MANEKGRPFTNAAAPDETEWLRDGPPDLLHQLGDLLDRLVGPVTEPPARPG
ncbi:hypothetical protein [Sphingorhabdus sp. EL138]|uniref:hypothetical protein n=1 Tax=Sphingorhabdus sp. EL138 TaxID=2073156 RepID=UPI0025CCB1BB|nr:hypothetical protein [Sphingorhabdus sp. EL138]